MHWLSILLVVALCSEHPLRVDRALLNQFAFNVRMLDSAQHLLTLNSVLFLNTPFQA